MYLIHGMNDIPLILYRLLIKLFVLPFNSPISELTIIIGIILFLFYNLTATSSCLRFFRTGSITGLKRSLGTIVDNSFNAINSYCLPLSKGKYIYHPFQCSLIVFLSAISDESE